MQNLIAPQLVRSVDKTGTSPLENLYSIRQLSEHQLKQLYELTLQDACSYARCDWKIAQIDSAAGYWGDGISGGNDGIRTVVSMLLACATLLKYGDDVHAALHKELLDKSRAALLFTAQTHRTGTKKCMDGKQWGATAQFGSESWQSGMWTGTLAWSAWLIWDELGLELQEQLQRVIAWECDILSRRQPPHGLWLDTKAEENGWEVPCLVLGSLMFPSHPHIADWREGALRYMMNTLCTEADTHDTSLRDGRPVYQWVKGPNLQPDYTLENHNRFHPSYVGCSCYFLTQAVMYYAYARQPIPQAAAHHLLDTWKMFQAIILPWGEAAYPQGMDWELHGLPFINLYASLSTHWRDPYAAHMEQSSLQYLRAWQAMGHGSLSIPGSRLGMTRHAINAEQIAYGLLAHKIFGTGAHELSRHATALEEQGVRDYPYLDFIVHRTANKFVSFSWKNRIMGMLIPIGDRHEGNPDFAVPIDHGFVGSFELEASDQAKTEAKITVIEHERRRKEDGFETIGTLSLNGGRLQQTLKMTSLGDQTIVYEDRVIALTDVTVQKELGLPIGIENDEITGGMRVISSQDGEAGAKWRQPKPPLLISGSWVNVDNRLGVVVLAGSGILYAQGNGYLPGISVGADLLYCSYSNRPRRFTAGQEVARRMAVLFVEVTPQQTSSLAQSCKIEDRAGTKVLRLKQPGGSEAEVPLLAKSSNPA